MWFLTYTLVKITGSFGQIRTARYPESVKRSLQTKEIENYSIAKEEAKQMYQGLNSDFKGDPNHYIENLKLVFEESL